jgi:hypothetical protein
MILVQYLLWQPLGLREDGIAKHPTSTYSRITASTQVSRHPTSCSMMQYSLRNVAHRQYPMLLANPDSSRAVMRTHCATSICTSVLRPCHFQSFIAMQRYKDRLPQMTAYRIVRPQPPAIALPSSGFRVPFTACSGRLSASSHVSHAASGPALSLPTLSLDRKPDIRLEFNLLWYPVRVLYCGD